MATVDLDNYFFIVVLTCIFGFVYAFGIGANDVANAFATTVASGSLTLKQAVLVASIFEFSGAFFLGASVTNTIRSKIFNVSLYDNEPEVLMLGMMTSLMTATVFLLVATAYGLPVSTTHTVVGAIMGFSIAAKGFDSIDWEVARGIFLSWLISPLVSGVVSFCFFASVKYGILNSEDSFQRAFYTFPLILTCGIGIDAFYIMYKGLNNVVDLTDELGLCLGASFGVGAFIGLIWIWPFGPIVIDRIDKYMLLVAPQRLGSIKISEPGYEDGAAVKELDTSEENDANVETLDTEQAETPDMEKAESPDTEEDVAVPEDGEAPTSSFHRLSKKFASMTYGQDLKTQSFHENSRAAEIWAEGITYDIKTEQLFTYVQVFTACLNSFAHGANDVANAIAPISAVVYIYQTGELTKKSEVQKWILAYGGVGLVVGLLLYGYNVMRSLGYKMTVLSPSRGASAELAASLFVVTASFLSIPVSSTQSICGAVVGVGVVNGWKNVQWLFFLRVCCGWVAIFFTATICSSGFFAFVAWSPTLNEPTSTQNATDTES